MEVAELFPLIHKSMKELVAQQLMVNFSTIYVRRRDVQSATVEHITQAMQIYFTPNDINHLKVLRHELIHIDIFRIYQLHFECLTRMLWC